MSTITGVAGSVTLGDGPTAGTDINIFTWTATIAGDILDNSTFETSHNVVLPIRGMYDLKGSFQGLIPQGAVLSDFLWDMLTVNRVPTTTFVLLTKAAKSWDFTGLVTEVYFETPKTERILVTCSFESSGAVTVSDA